METYTLFTKGPTCVRIEAVRVLVALWRTIKLKCNGVIKDRRLGRNRVKVMLSNPTPETGRRSVFMELGDERRVLR